MGELVGFDLSAHRVAVAPALAGTEPSTLKYEWLVVAGGSAYSHSGHEGRSGLALDAKSLDGALEVRGRILAAFEAAELGGDPRERAEWPTFVVTGLYDPVGFENPAVVLLRWAWRFFSHGRGRA